MRSRCSHTTLVDRVRTLVRVRFNQNCFLPSFWLHPDGHDQVRLKLGYLPVGILIRAQEELFNKLHITSGPMGRLLLLFTITQNFLARTSGLTCVILIFCMNF